MQWCDQHWAQSSRVPYFLIGLDAKKLREQSGWLSDSHVKCVTVSIQLPEWHGTCFRTAMMCSVARIAMMWARSWRVKNWQTPTGKIWSLLLKIAIWRNLSKTFRFSFRNFVGFIQGTGKCFDQKARASASCSRCDNQTSLWQSVTIKKRPCSAVGAKKPNKLSVLLEDSSTTARPHEPSNGHNQPMNHSG